MSIEPIMVCIISAVSGACRPPQEGGVITLENNWGMYT